MVPRNLCEDWIFIDAFGFWSLNEPGYKKMVIYALVTRYPFDGYLRTSGRIYNKWPH